MTSPPSILFASKRENGQAKPCSLCLLVEFYEAFEDQIFLIGLMPIPVSVTLNVTVSFAVNAVSERDASFRSEFCSVSEQVQ